MGDRGKNFLKSNLKKLIGNNSKIYQLYSQPKFRALPAQLTSLPDFIIIGGMKCGTTSLYDFITRHPGILPAKKKEIHFFDEHYLWGKSWYASNFPLLLDKKNLEIELQHRVLTGEATPNYMIFPFVPKRIKNLIPTVKLIAILRNPVDRTYSHYQHAIKKNHENLSLEDSIKIEEKRLDSEKEKIFDQKYKPYHYRYHTYLHKGHYEELLKNWYNEFPKDQILIVDSDKLKKNPKIVLNDIFTFLNLPSFIQINYNNLLVGKYPEMNPSTRNWLIEYFKPHNQKLYKLLDRTFDWDK